MVAWTGRCSCNANSSGYCIYHQDEKCVICGNQAVEGCSEFFGGVVCNKPLCSNPKCKSKHRLDDLNDSRKD